MQKVMLGMSGGVDSSVAAAVLMEKGFIVKGCTLLLCEGEDDNTADAKNVCDKLGIEHNSFDLRKEFKEKVICDFTNKYISGLTPNPCIECNRNIKFGKMFEIAIKNGCEKIATGHYARIEEQNGRFLLKKAKDETKDQSYVLYMLNQEQLSKILLPLGEFTKAEIRKKAEELNLINANRPDSQDICFVPDGDYASFIENNFDYISKKGKYVDINGKVLGEHNGVIRYTLGQRKGLGIALGKPQFVIDKNALTNEVVLGDEEHLFKTRVEVKNVNFIPFDTLEEPMRVEAKLRYRHKAALAVISQEDDKVIIEFDEPQRAASPGQAAVFYNGDTVIGGGTII